MTCEVTVQDVETRLNALGFPVQEADAALLGYTLEKAAQYIRNDCNITDIPPALKYALTDLAASDFLLSRKAVTADGGAEGALNFEQAVKSIQEGDTTVTFLTAGEGGATPETRLDALVSRLRADAQEQLLPFRRIKW